MPAGRKASKGEQKNALVLQIMGQTALVLRVTASGFVVAQVGPNFRGVAKQDDIVFLIPMNLPGI